MTINNIYQYEVIENIDDEKIINEFKNQTHPELSLLECIINRNFKLERILPHILECLFNSSEKIILLIDSDSLYSIIQRYDNFEDMWHLHTSKNIPTLLNLQGIKEFANLFSTYNQKSHKIYRLDSLKIFNDESDKNKLEVSEKQSVNNQKSKV